MKKLLASLLAAMLLGLSAAAAPAGEITDWSEAK